jgi:hypothetical protein
MYYVQYLDDTFNRVMDDVLDSDINLKLFINEE